MARERHRARPRLRAVLLAGAAASALALSGCLGGGGGGGSAGGGGGGGPVVITLPPTPIPGWNTAEFQANYGLARINAGAAYEAGWTGAGVTVAVLDAGFASLSDLPFSAASGAYNPIPAGSTAAHGNWVSSVIGARRNGTGIHGVAFNSTLLALDIGVTANRTLIDVTHVPNAVNYAAGQGARIVNASFGNNGLPTNFDRATWQDAVNRGMLVVFAAGNSGLSQPSAQSQLAIEAFANGQILAVGAVDATNTIASFSNRAGVAANRFLVAPGVGIPAYNLFGVIENVNGTSFAAPHVAGAAAVLLHRWPTLTATQVADILLATATDLGPAGTDAIYGRGLLNLGAALQPLGSTVLAGSGAPLDGTALVLGPAFGTALVGHPLLSSVTSVDSYGRDFAFDLTSSVAPTAASSVSVGRWLGTGRRWAGGSAAVPGGGQLSLASREWAAMNAEERAGIVEPTREAFAFTAGTPFGIDLAVARGHDPNAFLGLSVAAREAAAVSTAGPGVLASPYAAMAAGGTFAGLSGRLGQGFAWRLAVAEGDERELPDGAPSAGNSATFAEASYDLGPVLVGVQAGRVEEDGGLLGTAGAGAFALSGGAPTDTFGVFAAASPARGVTLLGGWSYGGTDASGLSSALASSFSDVRSDAYSMAAVFEDVGMRGDALTVSFTRPMRVRSGTATLSVPTGRLRPDGTVDTATADVPLEPGGVSRILEVGYDAALGGGRLSLIGGVETEPGHVAGAAPNTFLGARWRASF
jgi:hypothetical protein